MKRFTRPTHSRRVDSNNIDQIEIKELKDKRQEKIIKFAKYEANNLTKSILLIYKVKSYENLNFWYR